jgi:hypothetical protein
METKQETNNVTSREMTLEELMEEIELQYLMKGCETCTIHEFFNKNGECIYELKHLSMELDDQFVCCDDENHVLQQRRSVLMIFLKDCLLSVRKVFKQGKAYEELNFKDGKVILEFA